MKKIKIGEIDTQIFNYATGEYGPDLEKIALLRLARAADNVRNWQDNFHSEVDADEFNDAVNAFNFEEKEDE